MKNFKDLQPYNYKLTMRTCGRQSTIPMVSINIKNAFLYFNKACHAIIDIKSHLQLFYSSNENAIILKFLSYPTDSSVQLYAHEGGFRPTLKGFISQFNIKLKNNSEVFFLEKQFLENNGEIYIIFLDKNI